MSFPCRLLSGFFVMITTATSARFHELFSLRVAIARLGESDAFGWWNSYALTDVGEFALPRIFRRTPELTAAHLSLMAARLRHDQGVPKEPLIHLFNFGEAFEGSFERWLIEQKAEGQKPELPSKPAVDSVASALKASGIDLVEAEGGPDHLVLGTLREADLANPVARKKAATRLAGAYTASERGRLVIPYFRREQ